MAMMGLGMKLHKITWFMLGVGVLDVALSTVLNDQNIRAGAVSPLEAFSRLLGSASFLFFAGVLEFLARMTDVLESAARAPTDE
jgi:hypothetical protein